MALMMIWPAAIKKASTASAISAVKPAIRRRVALSQSAVTAMNIGNTVMGSIMTQIVRKSKRKSPNHHTPPQPHCWF
jgi:hypothetical protein